MNNNRRKSLKKLDTVHVILKNAFLEFVVAGARWQAPYINDIFSQPTTFSVADV